MSRKPIKSLRTPNWRELPTYLRLKYAVREIFARFGMARFSVLTRQGSRLLIDRENFVDRHLLVRGTWEAEQLSTLKELTSQQYQPGEHATFIDIGAHGGYYAIQMSKLMIFDHLLCIEADAHNAAQLHANLFLNDLTLDINVIHGAATDKTGPVFLKPGQQTNRGQSSVVGVSTSSTTEVRG
ncbi:MAG: hypothetical protein AAFO75_05745, partial [Pseudomonadota bacterium]